MATLKPRTGTRLSVEEFMELPDTFDKRKMELDEGELYIMPRLCAPDTRPCRET